METSYSFVGFICVANIFFIYTTIFMPYPKISFTLRPAKNKTLNGTSFSVTQRTILSIITLQYNG